MKNTYESCITMRKKVSIDYLWTIRNFTLFSKQEIIKSSVFSPSNTDQQKWQLELNPCYKEYYVDKVKVYLILVDFKGTSFTVSAKLSIVKNDNSVCSESIFSYDCLNKDQDILQINLERTELLLKENGYLQDNTLRIVCKVESSIDKVEHLNQDLSDLDVPDNYELLSKNLNALLKDERLTDICLEVDKVKFNLHKNILAARSPVFAAMFEHEMKENQENVIQIRDMDASVAREMINYVYTGQVQDLETKALELVKVADKYDLNGLKTLCENSLCKSLTVDNAFEVLRVADLHNLIKLKLISIHFIKFHLTEMIQTPALLELTGSNSLIIEIFKSLALKN